VLPRLAALSLTLAAVPTAAAQAPPVERDTLRMAFVGDINFARSLAQLYIFGGRREEIFAGVRDRLRAADLTIGNLESLILERGERWDPPGSPTFAGPVEALPLLLEAGFDAVSTANNHSWDFGREGLLESLGHLERFGIPQSGTGSDVEAAWRPALLRAQGWTVAVFGLTYIINHPSLTVRGTPAECCIAWADTTDAERWFRLARDSLGADLVIAFVHQGWVEYRSVPDLRTVALFRGLIRAGADAVIGHHPHVPQGWEIVEGRPVVYSLGNFVFRQLRPWTDRGLVAELTWAPGGSWRLDLVPVAAGYAPAWLAGADSARVMRHVETMSRRIGLPNAPARRNVARPSDPRTNRGSP
jgi:poly-gamma-glutamate synthesis protein (capsule biosynthesis protein)